MIVENIENLQLVINQQAIILQAIGSQQRGTPLGGGKKTRTAMRGPTMPCPLSNPCPLSAPEITRLRYGSGHCAADPKAAGSKQAAQVQVSHCML